MAAMPGRPASTRPQNTNSVELKRSCACPPRQPFQSVDQKKKPPAPALDTTPAPAQTHILQVAVDAGVAVNAKTDGERQPANLRGARRR